MHNLITKFLWQNLRVDFCVKFCHEFCGILAWILVWIFDGRLTPVNYVWQVLCGSGCASCKSCCWTCLIWRRYIFRVGCLMPIFENKFYIISLLSRVKVYNRFFHGIIKIVRLIFQLCWNRGEKWRGNGRRKLWK